MDNAVLGNGERIKQGCNVMSGTQFPKSPISCNTIYVRIVVILLFSDIGSMFPYKIALPLFLLQLLLLLMMMMMIIVVQFY